jgi:hypothetical protein
MILLACILFGIVQFWGFLHYILNKIKITVFRGEDWFPSSGRLSSTATQVDPTCKAVDEVV